MPIDIHQKFCGRPTKSGDPCRRQLYGPYLFSCSIHETANTKRLTQMLVQARNEGSDNALRYDTRNAEIERLRARVKELESVPCKHIRTHDYQGRQLVVVGGGYTYHWDGQEPLQIGDQVLLPGSDGWYGRQPWESEVLGLQSEYQGPTSGVIRVVKSKELENA